PWETSDPVRAIRTTAPATRWDTVGGVSRGHSNRDPPTKGRTSQSKESVGDASMGAERQQGRAYQLTFDFEASVSTGRHDRGVDDGIRPARPEEPRTPVASDPARAFTERLMEEVCRPENLNQAYRRVKANKGAPGVDGMATDELRAWLAEHKGEL